MSTKTGRHAGLQRRNLHGDGEVVGAQGKATQRKAFGPANFAGIAGPVAKKRLSLRSTTVCLMRGQGRKRRDPVAKGPPALAVRLLTHSRSQARRCSPSIWIDLTDRPISRPKGRGSRPMRAAPVAVARPVYTSKQHLMTGDPTSAVLAATRGAHPSPLCALDHCTGSVIRTQMRGSRPAAYHNPQ